MKNKTISAKHSQKRGIKHNLTIAFLFFVLDRFLNVVTSKIPLSKGFGYIIFGILILTISSVILAYFYTKKYHHPTSKKLKKTIAIFYFSANTLIVMITYGWMFSYGLLQPLLQLLTIDIIIKYIIIIFVAIIGLFFLIYYSIYFSEKYFIGREKNSVLENI